MDLRRVRHFITLAETLNFRKAAARLHMAQPPLSVSIQKLEAELGTRLFVRTPNGVTLTPSGHAALLEARRLMFHGTQFAQIARSAANGGGTLHVGFVASSAHGLLQALVPRFCTAYPGVELTLHEATSTQIVQSLEEDTLDVGLVRTPLASRSATSLVTLQNDELIAALPRASAYASKPALELGDLADAPFIMYPPTEAGGLHAAAMLACQQSGFLPHVSQEAVQIQTVLALVESGLGVALVPSAMQRFASERVSCRRFSHCPPAAVIGHALVYRREMETTAAQRFRMLASQVFPLEH